MTTSSEITTAPHSPDDLSSLFSYRPGRSPDDLQMSFADYLHGSADYGQLARAFDMSCSSFDQFGKAAPQLVAGNLCSANGDGGGGTMTPVTPNCSGSSSSTEYSGRWKKDLQKEEEEEEKRGQEKEDGDGGGKSKKVNKPRKKGEKRQREQRFAFMTKSEVDHLEDGYRWRKYGQKAVKNSSYPRSYYRCTTQKCSVKKRVERSYQDPSIVITTYEGQHTHPIPSTVRGSSHILAPPPAISSSFRPGFLVHHQLPQLNYNGQQQGGELNPSMFMIQSLPSPLQQLQLQIPDYGLLQDIVPSFINTNHIP